MNLFVRITAIVAVSIVALIVLGFVLKVVVFAALVAALVLGGLTLYNMLRRRRPGPVMTYTARR